MKRQDTLNISTDTIAPPYIITGRTGLKRSGGWVYEEWHPKLSGQKAIKVYREMRDNDAVIGAFLYVLNAYIQQADITITPTDDTNLSKQISDHVESCIDDMSISRKELLGEILSMAWAGFSYHSIIYKVRRGSDAPLPQLRSKYRDGLVGWRKLPIRGQSTIWRWKFDDDDGSVQGAYQMSPPDYQETFLPIEHSLLYRISYNKGNPEGRSLLRNAYRSWYFLKRIQELEAIGVERDMAGMLVLNLPVEYFDENATSAQKATVAEYRKIAERIRRGQQEGLVFPAPEDDGGRTGFDAHLMQSGGRRPMDVDGIIKRLESRIALSVLGDSVLMGNQGNVGSWALHSGKTHMLAIGIKGIMDAMADTMSRYALSRLVRINGWPEELTPKWEFGDIETDESLELMQSLVAAVGSGLITPGPEIEQYLRMRMGLPPAEHLDLGSSEVREAMERIREEGERTSPEVAAEAAIPIPEQEGTESESLDLDRASEYTGIKHSILKDALLEGELKGTRTPTGWRMMRPDLDRFKRDDYF